MNKKKNFKSSLAKKFKDASYQTDPCNPVHILINETREYCENADKEIKKLMGNLKEMKDHTKELELMIKLFEMDYTPYELDPDCIQKSKKKKKKKIKLPKEKNENKKLFEEDPEVNKLEALTKSFKKEICKEKKKRCKLLKELKLKGVSGKARKSIKYNWDECLKDFVPGKDEEENNRENERYELYVTKPSLAKLVEAKEQVLSDIGPAYECYLDIAKAIIRAIIRNSITLEKFQIYKHTHNMFFSHTEWSPGLYVKLKNFIRKQELDDCLPYSSLDLPFPRVPKIRLPKKKPSSCK